MLHLYWASDKPHLLVGISTGVAACGERGVRRQYLTCNIKAVECPVCRIHKEALAKAGQARAVQARAPAPAPVAPRPRSTGGKATEIADMMRRPGGVTREEVLAALGWTAVSMQQQAKAAGVTMEIDKSRKPYRYIVI